MLKSVIHNGGFLMFIHKIMEEKDFYYLVNTNEHKTVSLEYNFRVKDKTPEIWNPTDGIIQRQALYWEQNRITILLINLKPKESIFVVFTDKKNPIHFIPLKENAGKYCFQVKTPLLILHLIFFTVLIIRLL